MATSTLTVARNSKAKRFANLELVEYDKVGYLRAEHAESNRTRRPSNLELSEYDKAGSLRAKFVESNRTKDGARIDIVLPTEKKELWLRLLDIFLPDGFPRSVTDDYVAYQLCDSLQAFACSISGMISSRAVWEGLGVGDASASATGAMLIQVIRECMGKLSTITFAHLMGTSIEAECKAYRLASDILCDTAMVLDCLSPIFPIYIRLLVLCLSSILYAAAGIAGGSSKASLSGHFARWNNVGELNAKENSQETVISLMGNLTGTLVIAYLTTSSTTWIVLIFLLGVHLTVNRMGVRAVKLRSLNRQRANMVFSNILAHDKVLTPAEVCEREFIFEKRGGEVYRWASGPVIGHCKFGVSLNDLLRCMAQNDGHEKTGSLHLEAVDLSALMDLFRNQQYMLWCQTRPHAESASKIKVLVVLKDGITPKSQLRAWHHGLLLAWRLHSQKDSESAAISAQAMLRHVASTLVLASRTFEDYAQRLTKAGWDLDIPVLETRSGCRIQWEGGETETFVSSPRLASPRLASPRVTSPRIVSPRATSFRW